MFKKLSMIVVIFFILFLISSPNVLSNELTENRNGFGFRSIFTVNPLIIIEYDPIEEFLKPNSGVLEIPLTTSFEIGGLFRNLKTFLFRNTMIQIELSIEDKPNWCEARIENPQVQLPLGHTEPFISILTVTCNQNAPAFHQGIVKVKAVSNEVSGIFFTRVRQFEKVFDISFVVDFRPLLSLEIEDTFIKIPPLIETTIPITIENFGNGPIFVTIEIDDIHENWNFVYPIGIDLNSPISGKGYKKEVEIKVIPPKYFINQTINITINHSYLGKPNIQGEPISFSLVLQNNNSSLQEGFGITLISIMIAGIFLISFISRFFKRKQPKK
jgi:hypothetical protein